MTKALRISIAIGVAASCAAFSWTGCDIVGPSVWVETTRTLELESADVEKLVTTADNGHVHVRVGEETGDATVVKATIKAGGRDEEDARECLEAIEIQVRESGSTRSVRAVWKTEKSRRWRKSVSYDIAVPTRFALEVETDNGEVDVRGVEGPCRLESDNGRIKVRDGAGDLTVKTDNGKIDVQTRSARIDLETDNGSITASIGGGELDGRIVTDNGSVSLELPGDASAKITARTDNGKITSRVELRDVEHTRKTLKGRLGDGRGVLEIRTDNGSISLKGSGTGG